MYIHTYGRNMTTVLVNIDAPTVIKIRFGRHGSAKPASNLLGEFCALRENERRELHQRLKVWKATDVSHMLDLFTLTEATAANSCTYRDRDERQRRSLPTLVRYPQTLYPSPFTLQEGLEDPNLSFLYLLGEVGDLVRAGPGEPLGFELGRGPSIKSGSLRAEKAAAAC